MTLKAAIQEKVREFGEALRAELAKLRDLPPEQRTRELVEARIQDATRRAWISILGRPEFHLADDGDRVGVEVEIPDWIAEIVKASIQQDRETAELVRTALEEQKRKGGRPGRPQRGASPEGRGGS